eukprot:COSAG06_NODE_59009_length_275_cov_0.886364_1_plen_57_part_01
MEVGLDLRSDIIAPRTLALAPYPHSGYLRCVAPAGNEPPSMESRFVVGPALPSCELN